ncbi:MAG: signal recognition particle-docking protein FtsY [Thermodesulfobacteriota bacterium]|nr:signal recognition particle-docking protein FtsY [Thermodesulfobacteriota bacterium]
MFNFFKKGDKEKKESRDKNSDDEKKDLFQNLRSRLKKTRDAFIGKIDKVISSKKEIDDDILEELEDVLITADIGINTVSNLLEEIKKNISQKDRGDPQKIKEILKRALIDILKPLQKKQTVKSPKPFIILVIGVNGVGKTTTIAKLAHMFKKEGRRVMIAAADTFRAAAVEQLEIWGERVGCDVIKHNEKSDPASVVFDAVHAAKARGIDILIIDTAGRLHTKTNLMEELKKIKKIANREIPDSAKETLLILDAITGQNAVSQAKLFTDSIGVDGLVLTKLDSTAKGGIVIRISQELKIPIYYICIGEKLDDLQEFSSNEFIDALFVE